MIVEIVVVFFIGVLAGVFTGLFPGIHINLVAAGLLALVSGALIFPVEPIVLVVFVVAMAVTHTFIDFIPSIFLGAPEEDSFLAVLPGHQMLTEGKGFEAIVMTLYGSLVALPVVLIFVFLFLFFLSDVYEFFKVFLPYVLILVSLYLVFTEEEWILSGVVFLFSGFLGMFVFNLPVREPLLPLLTGLFGVSSLLVSMQARVQIPEQKISDIRKIRLGRKDFWRTAFAGALAAPVCSFLPGIGSGHATIIGSELSGNLRNNHRSFLFLNGMINTVVMALSFVTIYAIGRTRTGAAVAVESLLGDISFWNLILVIGVVFAAGIFAFVVGVGLARFFSTRVHNVDYRAISMAVLALLFAVNVFLTNIYGIIVLVTASALGVFCIQSRVRRIQLMGALLVPTILFYLF